MRKDVLLAGAIGVFAWGCGSITAESKVPVELTQLSAGNVIDDLDRHFQALLADLALTKESAFKTRDPKTGKMVKVKYEARLGARRMAPIFPLHPDLSPKGDHGRLVDGWDYYVELFGAGGKPITETNLQQRTGIVSHEFPAAFRRGGTPGGEPTYTERLRELAKTHLKGGKSTGDFDGWSLEARSVLLSKPECLSCHKDSKLNEPIGVLVYSVRPAKTSK